MNYNERKFNMDIAQVCGLREAVIADFIRGLQAISDETTYRHGYFWVKCTQKMITVHIPFLTEDMVRHSVNKLVESGIIKVLDLKWDMSDMPENSRGVFNYACGDFTKIFNSRELRMSYFAAGIMKAVETENFGVYWFSDPDTDMLPLAEKLKDMYLYNSKFFNDENGVYRIFFRRDPFEKSDGGSAAYRSFMIGYSALGTTDWDRLYTVLCHEMIHNWPMMDDSITGTATWYNEGCAEYYCTMLPLRAGFATAEYEADQINEKLGIRYYDNPLRELPNMELAKIQWQDRRGQIVPYGRGMVYLANTDAELKRAGKPSIDTIITSYNWDNQITLEIWENFIRENLGEEGIREFEDMKAGKLIKPDPDAFDGKFDFYEVPITVDGETMTSDIVIS